MIQSAQSRRLLAATAILAVFLLGACSKSNSTGPPGGGGTTKELNSPNLANGGVYPHTFPMTAKTYPYHCRFHSVMTASVVVSGGGPATASVAIGDNNFSPNVVTVGPGGVVTWTNNGVNTHSVTSD